MTDGVTVAGHAACVTGCSRGIGRAIATHLTTFGASVAGH